MKIAVVQGGPSTEAEVSRASARAVVAALRTAGHEAEALELDGEFTRRLSALAPDVVFPVSHGELGEDGCLQGALEVLGFPYVGSGVRAAAIASDKVASKVFFTAAGLPLARQAVIRRGDAGLADVTALRGELARTLGDEFILKPAGGGSTLGITRVLATTTDEEFRRGLDGALELDATVLVEAYHRGREATCGVLEGDDGPIALPPTLIHSQSADWYDFTSKYGSSGSRHECPAPFPSELLARIQDAAVRAHRAVGARDLSRTDFIVHDDGSFIVLELNNLPGMTGVSLFPEAAQAAGIGFPELVDRLARRALARSGARVARGAPLPA